MSTKLRRGVVGWWCCLLRTMQDFTNYITAMITEWPSWAILATAFVVVFIENLIPPWPGDVLLVFFGTLVASQIIGFEQALAAATLGSCAGFFCAYALGRKYGAAIAESPWVPFITPPLIVKVERWFDRYHGLIIVSNRFLAGTRSVIAFTAGIVKLPLPRTLVYATISSMVWNTILLMMGNHLGQNWHDVELYMTRYGWAVTILLVLFGLYVWYRRRKRRTKKSAAV